MGEVERLNVVYCEGWDPANRLVVGRLAAATARERDRVGEQYAVCLVDPETGMPVVLVEIAWRHHFARCWYFDGHVRRHLSVEYRRIEDDRLFQLQNTRWTYASPEQQELDDRAERVKIRHDPDGTAYKEVRSRGSSGGLVITSSTMTIAVDRVFTGVPQFADWNALVWFDVELGEEPDPASEHAVDPPWRPVVPLRPRGLDLMFEAGTRWSLPGMDSVVTTEVTGGGVVRLLSGRLVVADPGWLEDDLTPLRDTIAPGEYRVTLSVLRSDDNPDRAWVAAAKLLVANEPVVSWELALRGDQNPLLLGDGEFYGFGVDAGMGCFVDAEGLGAMEPIVDESFDTLSDVSGGESVEVSDPKSGATLVAFGSGRGDGSYPAWVGRTAEGAVACFVADMLLLRNAEVLAASG
jgi:hypothetical protein